MSSQKVYEMEADPKEYEMDVDRKEYEIDADPKEYEMVFNRKKKHEMDVFAKSMRRMFITKNMRWM
jgi:hypothetical protein